MLQIGLDYTKSWYDLKVDFYKSNSVIRFFKGYMRSLQGKKDCIDEAEKIVVFLTPFNYKVIYVDEKLYRIDVTFVNVKLTASEDHMPVLFEPLSPEESLRYEGIHLINAHIETSQNITNLFNRYKTIVDRFYANRSMLLLYHHIIINLIKGISLDTYVTHNGMYFKYSYARLRKHEELIVITSLPLVIIADRIKLIRAKTYSFVPNIRRIPITYVESFEIHINDF